MPANNKLNYEDVEATILVACLEAHLDGRPLPSYAEIGAIAGRGEDWGRSVMQTMLGEGILIGVPGRKPIGMSEAGVAKAASCRDSGMALCMADPAAVSVATSVSAGSRSPLVEDLAARFGVDPGRMFDLVSKTMINKRPQDGPVTKEEVAMVMHVMRQYDVDPIIKQLHAFVTDGRLQVMLGYDGWVKQVNQARASGCLGVEFNESGERVKVPQTNLECPRWVEATLRWSPKIGRVPTVYRAQFEEWFVPNANWRARPYHRLRMKAYCQAAREALGIGLCDELDIEQIQWQADHDGRLAAATAARSGSIAEGLTARLEALRALADERAPVEAAEGFPEAVDAEVEPAAQEPAQGDLSDLELDARLLREQIDNGEVSN